MYAMLVMRANDARNDTERRKVGMKCITVDAAYWTHGELTHIRLLDSKQLVPICIYIY